MSHLYDTILVAQSAHKRQPDKTGRFPYHALPSGGGGRPGKVVAYLHDVVEKG